MATAQQILEVFRRYDTRGDGLISREQLSKVLKLLDSDRWVDSNIDLLFKTAEVRENRGAIPYEEFVIWVMTGVDAAIRGSKDLPKADPICQAAFDGQLQVLRGLLQAEGASPEGADGFVEVDGVVVGLWTMGLQGFNTFELRSLALEPSLRSAGPLHYAAFAGKADIVGFLLEECGMKKDDEGDFGISPSEIVRCHRLGLDGDVVVDDGSALLLLDEEEDEPLPAANLQRTVTRSVSHSIRCSSNHE